jgi:hypothetical protein
MAGRVTGALVGHSMGGDDVESLARRGVRAVLVPGVGHFVMLEDPNGFNRLLDEAIRQFGLGCG